MAKFQRRDNYEDDFLKKVNAFLKAGILVVPNKDCLKGYFNGLVLIDRLTERSFNLIGSENAINNYILKEEINKNDRLKAILADYRDNIKNKDYDTKLRFFDETKNDWFEILKYGMQRDKERKSSQKIALSNMTFEDENYSVCGWETTIGKDDSNLNKKPEIDLVVVNPSQKEMILVEYKCKKESMLGEKQDIFNHWEEYMQICKSANKDEPEIKNQLLKAFNVYRRIKELPPIPEKDFGSFKVKVGFLFVDQTFDDKGTIVSSISEADYKKGRKRLTEKLSVSNHSLSDLSKTLYIRVRTANNLELNSWKNLGKRFAYTVKPNNT